MKKYALMLISMFLLSCENVFENDELNYMWRLDKVGYSKGRDFSGSVCDEQLKSQHWVSLAREIVCLEKYHVSDTIRLFGVYSERHGSICFDFSIWPDTQVISGQLPTFGIGGVKSSFKIKTLNDKHMVLQGDSTVLYLTRW